MAWTTTVGSNIDKVDSRLVGALERAAANFEATHPGYSVVGFSGKKARSTGTKNHPAGKAVDVSIVDSSGRKLGNLKDASSFRTYEAFAQEVRKELDAVGLTDVGRWGGYFQQGTAYDQMHFDLGPRDQMALGSWENGLNARGRQGLPGAESVGLNQLSQFPDAPPMPMSREEAMRNQAIARAYNDPMRALDVVPGISPARVASQYGQYRPGTVPSAPAAQASTFKADNLNRGLFGRDSFSPTPVTPSSLQAAPVGRVDRAPLGPVSTPSPARSLAHPVSRPSAPAPSAPSISPAQAARFEGGFGMPDIDAQISAATKASSAVANAEMAPSPTSPTAGTDIGRAVQDATTAKLAEQYGQYRTPTAYQQVREKMQAVPAAPPVAPAAPPVAQATPAAVLAPALAQQPAPPVQAAPAQAAAPITPAAPKATAGDVYAGLATTGLDSVGNTVSSLPGGVTAVTNKYGVTTGMTPYGKQTAVAGPVGNLPGITPAAPKAPSQFGQTVKGALPGLAGAAVGTYLGGPVGGLLGGLLARAATQPGGLLGGPGMRTVNTMFGPIQAYAVDNSQRSFPGAPSGGYGSGGRMGASFSNRSHADMSSISPGAADAIGRGQGGLY